MNWIPCVVIHSGNGIKECCTAVVSIKSVPQDNYEHFLNSGRSVANCMFTLMIKKYIGCDLVGLAVVGGISRPSPGKPASLIREFTCGLLTFI